MAGDVESCVNFEREGSTSSKFAHKNYANIFQTAKSFLNQFKFKTFSSNQCMNSTQIFVGRPFEWES